MRIWLSYAACDASTARALANSLEARRISVGTAEKLLVAGTSWPEQISQEMKHADAVVFIISKHTEKNPYIHLEIGFSISTKTAVIPVLLDKDAKIPPLLSDIVAIDATSTHIHDVASLSDRIIDALQETKSENVGPSLESTRDISEELQEYSNVIREEEEYKLRNFLTYTFGFLFFVSLVVVLVLSVGTGIGVFEKESPLRQNLLGMIYLILPIVTLVLGYYFGSATNRMGHRNSIHKRNRRTVDMQ